MALKSPLMPSPNGSLSSAFSPYSDSPNSPAIPGNFNGSEKRSSGPSDSLAPPPSPYPAQVDPSPVDSNGTESTEIEDEKQDGVKSPLPEEGEELRSPDVEITSPQSASSDRVPKIDTRLPPQRSDSTENAPQSVIHAPEGYQNFEASRSSGASPTDRSEHTVVSPSTPEALGRDEAQRGTAVSPVNTDLPNSMERTTPRAQTRQELDEDYKRKSRRASSLEGLLTGFEAYFTTYLTACADIPEALDKDNDENENEQDDKERPSTAGLVKDGKMPESMEATMKNANEEISSLRTALSECWTLCNTLANLSSSHRQRTFKFGGRQDMQQQAWRSCWRLCQSLYDSRDKDHKSEVVPTLELCRDFCQSLFEARQKGDEASDSVLRVSFELNNHLYNTHDRALPEAFNERTLDFYITLCHRLMRQRTSLPQETDALLRACWSLAEMLFNLRQSNREGKAPDEELLGSAVQACWELCDLFREGWTQIRPDRGTPRPTQMTFGSQTSLKSSSSTGGANRSTSSLSGREQYYDAKTRGPPPETPTTIFDDATTATSSPESGSVPNILVLGPGSTRSRSDYGATHHDRWTSNASVLSGYSDSASSQRTSSTATAGKEDTHLIQLRYLLLKAGMNTGYSRLSGQTLPAYVKTLADNAFGTLPWQQKVLSFYKKLVMGDKSMLAVDKMTTRRLGANEAAKSVKWLGSGEQWAWMRDLYRIVYGFGVDDAERKGGSVQI